MFNLCCDWQMIMFSILFFQLTTDKIIVLSKMLTYPSWFPLPRGLLVPLFRKVATWNKIWHASGFWGKGGVYFLCLPLAAYMYGKKEKKKKQQQIFIISVSVDQEFRTGLASCFWLRISHEVADKKLARAVAPVDSRIEVQRSNSKMSHLNGCWQKKSHTVTLPSSVS